MCGVCLAIDDAWMNIHLKIKIDRYSYLFLFTYNSMSIEWRKIQFKYIHTVFVYIVIIRRQHKTRYRLESSFSVSNILNKNKMWMIISFLFSLPYLSIAYVINLCFFFF